MKSFLHIKLQSAIKLFFVVFWVFGSLQGFSQRNITINTAGPTSGGAWSGGTPDVFTPNADNAVIMISDITTRLASKGVTINTSGSGSQAGDVTISNNITVLSTSTTQNTFTINADGAININAALSLKGAAQATITPGINCSFTGGTGITTNGSGTITTTGGTPTSCPNAGGAGGYLTLIATTGSVTIGAAVVTTGADGCSTQGGGGAGGVITLTASNAAGSVVINGTLTAKGGTPAGGGSGGAGGNGANIIITAGNNVTIGNYAFNNSATSSTIGALAGGVSGNMTITATNGAITSSTNNFTSNGGSGNNNGGSAGAGGVINFSGGTGVTIGGTISTIGGNAWGTNNPTPGGNITISAATGNISLAALTLTGGANTNNVQPTGGINSGGVVNITATNGNVTVSGTINTVGGQAYQTTPGAGGSVTINAPLGTVSAAAITTTGGASSNSSVGAAGGAVVINSTTGGSVSVTGTINTAGGASTNGNGGNAGNVTIKSTTGSISCANITSNGAPAANNVGIGGTPGNLILNATGGTTVTVATINVAAGTSYGTSNGPNGGAVTITGPTGITCSSTIGASGGNGGGTSGNGGAGGVVTLTSTSGNISVTGTITSLGGTAVSNSTPGAGGNVTANTAGAGTVSLAAINIAGGNNTNNAAAASTNIGGNLSVTSGGNASISGTINTNGGTTTSTTTAGNSGTVGITSTSGSVTVAAIDTRGGQNGNNGGSGNGGAITLNASTGITLNGIIRANAYAGAGNGATGNGGAVSMTVASGNIVGNTYTINTDAATSGGTAPSGSGGAINLVSNAGGNISIGGTINSSGGNAAGTNIGKNAGNITITASGGTITTVGITAAGGNGSNAAGGNGGILNISASGNIQHGAINNDGGNSSSGQTNGSAANITISSSTGSVTTTSTIYSRGGTTGINGNGGNLSISAGTSISLGGNTYTYSQVSGGTCGTISLTGATGVKIAGNLQTYSVAGTTPGTLTINDGAVSTAAPNDGQTSGTINTGTASFTKTGAGTFLITSGSSYTSTGSIILTAGTLTTGAANKIPDGSVVLFNGGTLATSGAYAETYSTATLQNNSSISLNTSGVHNINFAASNGMSWTAGKMLTITGWQGTWGGGISGTAGRVFFGSANTGITVGQLAQVQFNDGSSNWTAQILASGEIVPLITTSYPDVALSSTNPAVAATTIYNSTTKQPIYKFTLGVTTANATVNTIAFTTTNSAAADITKYQLWYKTSDDLSTATQIGTDITTSLGTGSHSFSSLSQVINNGSTGYFWITVDVASLPTASNTIVVSAITTSDITIVSGNKTGTAYAGGTQTIQGTPLITNSQTTRTGFSYYTGSGPSSELSYTVTGIYLSNNIVITAPTNYEISTGTGGSFVATSPITLTQTGGNVATTTIYVRLKAGLAVAAYNGEVITHTSTGATQKDVTCSGDVLAVPTVTLGSNAVAAGNIVAGTTNNVVNSFTFTTTNATATLNQVVFANTGDAVYTTDITNYKLYYTSTSSTFATGTLLATITSGTTFTGLTQSLPVGGPYYFWITSDIVSSATAARTIIISAVANAGITYSSGLVNKAGSSSAGGTKTIVLPTVAINSANPAVAVSNIGQNTTNNVVSSIQMTVTNSTATVNTIAFTNTGNADYTSDITNYKLYYTSTSSTFATGTLLGTITSGSSFTGLTQALAVGGPYYFWITADIKPAATTSRTITISAISNASITFASATKSGSTNAGGTQTIIATAPVVTLGDNTQVTAANITVNSTSNILSRFQLAVSSANSATLNTVTFTTTGTAVTTTDLTNFKLWYCASNAFGSATAISTLTTSLSAGAHSFTGLTQSITYSTTGYFWITADVPNGATNNSTVAVSAMTNAAITLASGSVSGSATAAGTQTILTAAPVTYYYNGTGNWSTVGNFKIGSCGGAASAVLPTSNDIVYVNCNWGNTLTIDVANATCKDLNLSSGCGVTISGTNGITISGNYVNSSQGHFVVGGGSLTITGNATNSDAGNITVSTGSISVGGNCAMNGAGDLISSSTGNILIGGDLTIQENSGADLNWDAGTVTVNGNFTDVAGWGGLGGTKAGYFIMGGTSKTLTLGEDYTFPKVRLSSSTLSKAGTGILTINSDFDMNNQTAFSHSSNIYVSGTISNSDNMVMAYSGTPTFTQTGGGNMVNGSYYNLTTTTTALTLPCGKTITVANTFTNSTTITGPTSVGVFARVVNANTVVNSGNIGASSSYIAFSGTITGGTVGANVYRSSSIPASCVALVPAIALASSSQVSPITIGKGSVKNPLYEFDLTVTNWTTILNQVDFVTTNSAASDITKYQLWYNTTNNVGNATQIGSDITTSLGTGTHSFTGLTQSITFGTTGYLWVTVDVAAGAVASNTLSVSTAITTGNITVSAGSKSGSSSIGGLQTIANAATLTVSPTSLSVFRYSSPGTGPSRSKSFTMSATNLLNAPNNIVVSAPAHYEICATASGTYTSSLNIAYASSTLATTTIYVRLKSGLSQASYNSELVTFTGGGYAGTVTVQCDGGVGNTYYLAAGGNWNVAANWWNDYCGGTISGVVPGPLDSVVIGCGSEWNNKTLTVTANATVGAVNIDRLQDFIINPGITFTINGDLKIGKTTDWGEGQGLVSVGSGTLVVQGDLTLGYNNDMNGLKWDSGNIYVGGNLNAADNGGPPAQGFDAGSVLAENLSIRPGGGPMAISGSLPIPTYAGSIIMTGENKTINVSSAAVDLVNLKLQSSTISKTGSGVLYVTNNFDFNNQTGFLNDIGTTIITGTITNASSSTLTNDATLKIATTTNNLALENGTVGSTVEYFTVGAEPVTTGTYYNLTISGGGTKTLLGDIVINNVLSLPVAGYLSMNGKNITMNNWADGNITPLTTTDRYIIDASGSGGVFTINGVSATETANFPIGLSSSDADYCRVDIANADAAHTSFAITGVSNSLYTTYPSLTSTAGATGPITSKAVNYTWFITSASTSANVTFYWDRATKELTTFDRTNCATFHYASAWERKGTIGAATLFASTIYSRTGLFTGFSPGSVQEANGALPIELINFKAIVKPDVNLITWETASELNNDYFVVERSYDGTIWDEIYTCDGAGTSSINHSYSYEDADFTSHPNPYMYYRLKQVDYNGENTTSKIISVLNSSNKTSNIYVYPNPFDGSVLYLNGLKDSVLIELYNSAGAIIYKNDINVKSTVVIINLDNQLSPGIYTIKCKTENDTYMQQLLVK